MTETAASREVLASQGKHLLAKFKARRSLPPRKSDSAIDVPALSTASDPPQIEGVLSPPTSPQRPHLQPEFEAAIATAESDTQEDLRAELEECRRQLHRSVLSETSTKQECEQLRRDAEQAREELARAQTKHCRLKELEELPRLEAIKRDLEERLQREVTERHRAEAALHSELRQAQESVKNLTAQNEMLRHQNAGMQHTVEVADKAVRAERLQYDQLSALNDRLSATCQRLLQSNAEKTAAVVQATGQLASAQQQLYAQRRQAAAPPVTAPLTATAVVAETSDAGCKKLTESLLCLDLLIQAMHADVEVYKTQISHVEVDTETSDEEEEPHVPACPAPDTDVEADDRQAQQQELVRLREDVHRSHRELRHLRTQLSDQRLENKTLADANRRAKELLVAVAMGKFEKTLYAEVECLNMEVQAAEALAARFENLKMEKIRTAAERDGFRDITRLLEQRVFDLSREVKRLEQEAQDGQQPTAVNQEE
ncbi:hypothetical protein RI367_004157 [Sorochytrium milnesiophthora]